MQVGRVLDEEQVKGKDLKVGRRKQVGKVGKESRWMDRWMRNW